MFATRKRFPESVMRSFNVSKRSLRFLAGRATLSSEKKPNLIWGMRPTHIRVIAGASRISDTVVGMSGKDGHGAIELLGDQNAHQLMRPGHLAEIEHGVGA